VVFESQAGASSPRPSRSFEAAGTVAARLLNYIIGFGASILIARALGPEGRGAYFVIITVAMTALSVGHLSVEQANLFLWTEGHRRDQLIAGSLQIGVLAGCVVALATMGVTNLLGESVLPLKSQGLLMLALATIPLGLCTLYLNGLLIASGSMWTLNKALLVSSIVQLIGVCLLFISNNLRVASVVWLWAVASAIPLGFQLTRLIRRYGFSLAPRTVLGRILKLGLRYHVGMVAVFLILRVDILMLNAMSSARNVGLYSLAVTLTEATFLFTDSVAQSAVSAQITDEQGHLYTARIARTNFVLSLGVVLLLVTTGPFLIPLVFGAPFAQTVAPIVALAPGIVALAAQRPIGVFIVRANKPWIVSSASVATLFVHVCLNLLLIPQLGIVGAGIASSLTYCALALFYVGWFVTKSTVSFSDLRPRITDLGGPAKALGSEIRSRLKRDAGDHA
jgi:O-antigen/teichoic acid export membrane protein